MDYRKILTGGERDVTSEELNLMPQSNTNALTGIAKGSTANANCVITGATGTILPNISCTVTEGYVLLNGEVLKVDAVTVNHTPAILTDLFIFQKVVTNGDAADWDRKFDDGTPKNVFEKRRAVPVHVASISGTDLPVNGASMPQKIAAALPLATQSSRGAMSPADKLYEDRLRGGVLPGTAPGDPNVILQDAFYPRILAYGRAGYFDIAGGGSLAVNGFNILSATASGFNSDRTIVDIVFVKDLGTSNYMVLCSLTYAGGDPFGAGGVSLNESTKTSSGFSLALPEYSSNPQDMGVSFIVLPLP